MFKPHVCILFSIVWKFESTVILFNSKEPSCLQEPILYCLFWSRSSAINLTTQSAVMISLYIVYITQVLIWTIIQCLWQFHFVLSCRSITAPPVCFLYSLYQSVNLITTHQYTMHESIHLLLLKVSTPSPEPGLTLIIFVFFKCLIRY